MSKCNAIHLRVSPPSQRFGADLQAWWKISTSASYHTEKNPTVWVPHISIICEFDLCLHYHEAFDAITSVWSPVLKLVRLLGIHAA